MQGNRKQKDKNIYNYYVRFPRIDNDRLKSRLANKKNERKRKKEKKRYR